MVATSLTGREIAAVFVGFASIFPLLDASTDQLPPGSGIDLVPSSVDIVSCPVKVAPGGGTLKAVAPFEVISNMAKPVARVNGLLALFVMTLSHFATTVNGNYRIQIDFN